MRRHPETRTSKSALRYYAPPLAVLGVFGGLGIVLLGLLLTPFVPNGQVGPIGYALLLPLGYLALTLLSSFTLVKRARSGALWLPIVLTIMQLSWGIGFLTSRNKRN
jgi:hypothetical protein